MHYPLEISPDVELIRDVEYTAPCAGVALLLSDLARPKNCRCGRAPARVRLHARRRLGKRRQGGWRPRDLLLCEARFCGGGHRLPAERRGAIPGGNRGLQMRGAFPARARGGLRHRCEKDRRDGRLVGRPPRGPARSFTGGGDTIRGGDGGWGDFPSGVCAVCAISSGVNDFLQMPEKHHPGGAQRQPCALFFGGNLRLTKMVPRALLSRRSPVVTITCIPPRRRSCSSTAMRTRLVPLLNQ